MKAFLVVVMALVVAGCGSASEAAMTSGGPVVDVAIDPGGSYTSACGLGASGAVYGQENDVTIECVGDDAGAHVVCGQPGLIGWEAGPDNQITATCAADPK